MSSAESEGERSNPYVGLRPFFFEDSLYFFGRDRQINDLLALLRQNRFLGVVGSSGSGKSSLVRAGLLPMLLGGFLESERDTWALAQVKPGDTPLVNLAEGLIRAAGETATPDAIAALVEDIADRHVEAVTEYLGNHVADSNILLLVDQFEELFAFRNKAGDPGPGQAKERARRRSEASAYVDLMLRLAEYPGLPIYVVLTMRTDFLGDCDLFYGLPEALNIGRYLVPRLSRDELREAIECPATLAGATVAPRLLDQILNALGDRMDRLPVVQHALVRTFDEWVRCGRKGPIDLAHYDAVGGLERALNNDADAAMAGLDARHVEAMFRRLTNTDINKRQVRSPARISELMAVTGAERAAIDAVIKPLADKRRSFLYLSNDGDAADPRVDIAHESLIRNWDRLVGWTDAESQARDIYVDLVDRARRWKSRSGSLLEGPERRNAFAWVTATNPKRGWAKRYAEADDDFENVFAYLNASQKALYRGRGLKIALPVAILLSFAGTVVFSESERLAARYETIDEAVRLVEAMTANLYSELEFLPQSGDARRALLTRARAVGSKLNGFEDETDSYGFWKLILAGDSEFDILFETADSGNFDDGRKIDSALEKASVHYSKAVKMAEQRLDENPDAINWSAYLAIALGKLADTTDGNCKILKRVVELNEKISTEGADAYDWEFQSFKGHMALGIRATSSCGKESDHVSEFSRALTIARKLIKDPKTSKSRLRSIADDLFGSGGALLTFLGDGKAKSTDLDIGNAHLSESINLYERLGRDNPEDKGLLLTLVDAQELLAMGRSLRGDKVAADKAIARGTEVLRQLVRDDPDNARVYLSRLETYGSN